MGVILTTETCPGMILKVVGFFHPQDGTGISQVRRPPSDPRTYKVLRLENGLQVRFPVGTFRRNRKKKVVKGEESKSIENSMYIEDLIFQRCIYIYICFLVFEYRTSVISQVLFLPFSGF